MAKHTKGPWTFSEKAETVRGTPDYVQYHDSAGTQSMVCKMIRNDYLGRQSRLSSEDVANAHLISAAPDLLEALEDAVSTIKSAGMLRTAYKDWEQVITKAKGE